MINTVVENGKTYANITDLTEWAENKELRAVGPDAFRRLKAQIQELGEYKPLLCTPEGIVLGGNTRLRAYKELGFQRLWVSVIPTKDKNDLLKYNLSDNDNVGLYNENGLANLLSDYELKLEDYAVDFNEPIVLADIVGLGETGIEEDEVPEVSQGPAISQLGQVYQLGRHRLMCGDATKIEDVEKLMNGQKAHMVLTDPPYGINIVSEKGGVGGGTEGKYRPVLGDDSIQTAVDAYNLCASLQIPKLVFFGGNYFANTLPNSPCWLVWDKQDGKQVTFADCEIAWTNFKSPTRMFTHIWDGFRRDSEKGVNRVHPTQKPIKLMAEIMKDYGVDNENVLDLFGGSGSTLIACEQTNRQCFMMELDPQYCDVIRKRYAKFIGQEDQWEAVTPSV